MTSHEAYCEYLKRRSRLGLWYRNYFLYPLLCRHLRGRALDVGCGIGDMLRYRPGTVGVDINPETIEWCRSLGLEAERMEPDILPFPSSSFDSVILDNVLEHLERPEALLAEVRRVLVDAGTFLAGVPGRKGYAGDPDHKTFYDEDILRLRIESAGFRMKRVFHTPLKSAWLDRNLRPYAIYGVFVRG